MNSGLATGKPKHGPRVEIAVALTNGVSNYSVALKKMG